MAGTGIDITLTSSANTSGFEATAAAAGKTEWELKQMAEAAKDADLAMSGTWGQKGTQDLDALAKTAETAASPSGGIGKLGEVLKQVGGKGAAANDILDGLSRTLKGNERSAIGAAKGIGSLITLLASSGATLGLSAVALGAAALVSWVTKSKEAKAASEALAKTIAEIAKEFAQLNNTPQDKLAEAINTNNRALDEQLRKLQAIAEIEDARAKAQYELDKSNLDRERRTREAAGNPMSEREYAARQNQIETAEANRLAGRPVELAKQQAVAAAQAAARAEETAAKTFDQTAEKLAEIDYDGARKLQEVYDQYTTAMATATAMANRRLATEKFGYIDTDAIVAEKAAREQAAEAAKYMARYSIDAAAEEKKVLEQIERENKTRRDQAKEQVALQKAADDAALAAKEKAAELQERANTEQAKFDATEKARRAIQANANDQRTSDATKADRATAEDRKKAQAELDKLKADRKKAQAELDKLKADTEAAAQARMASGGAYEYTYEERAAIDEKQKALDKMGPATPAAPTAPAKPVKTTTYAPRTKGDKSPPPAADQPAAQGPSDQLPDLATPLRDAAQKAGDSATQSADSIAAAAEAAKAVADNTKPIDASALTSALQAAATAQQTASTQTAAGIQQMVSLAEQQTALARDQASKIATMTTQINSLRVEVGQLRAQVRAA
jgi:hypothetical protein